MYKKNFLSTFLCALMLIGCSACSPELESEPTSDSQEPAPVVVDSGPSVDSTEPEEPDRSWVTWTDCGGAVGEHACDFTFKDQDDLDWSLYDQHGKLTLLDFSTMWCSVCNNIATKGNEFEAKYGQNSSGAVQFEWITVLIDDSTGGTVDLADVQAWVNNYGINGTVLAGDRSIIDLTAAEGFPISSWPTLVLVGEEMEILAGWRGWNESWVSTAIEEHLN